MIQAGVFTDIVENCQNLSFLLIVSPEFEFYKNFKISKIKDWT
jgi:hypothetical protein